MLWWMVLTIYNLFLLFPKTSYNAEIYLYKLQNTLQTDQMKLIASRNINTCRCKLSLINQTIWLLYMLLLTIFTLGWFIFSHRIHAMRAHQFNNDVSCMMGCLLDIHHYVDARCPLMLISARDSILFVLTYCLAIHDLTLWALTMH